jgi:hypothetical protein
MGNHRAFLEAQATRTLSNVWVNWCGESPGEFH